jgi:tripartite ATP-independent transporter DctM subunit
MESILLVVVLFSLLLLSTPIFIALFLSSVIITVLFTTIEPMVFPQILFRSIDKFSLLAIPFFILTGELMSRGTIASRLVRFADILVGYLPGGLAIAGVVACGLFGSISGSTIATMVAIGGIMIPAMRERNYTDKFTLGMAASAPILGIVIPPSVPLIIYGLLASQSVGELFIAGFLPGLLIILAFSLYSIFYNKNRNIVREKVPSPAVFFNAVKSSIWALLLPVLIFGGIFSGVFTVTEAAAVSVLYSLIVEVLIFRDIQLKELPAIFIHSGLLTSIFVIIITGASSLGEYLTIEQIPQQMAEAVIATVKSPIAFLLIANFILLITGAFIDIISAILLLTPIFLPLLNTFHIDPIHFGMLMTINLGIGYLTPPMGVLLFIGMQMGGTDLSSMIKYVMTPFLILIFLLLVLTFFPSITLLLPNLLFR